MNESLDEYRISLMPTPQPAFAKCHCRLRDKLIGILSAAMIIAGCSSSDAGSQLDENSLSTPASVVASLPRMEIQPGANLSGQDLAGRNISCNDLYAVDLTGTNLTGASLSGSNLQSASLGDTLMTGADFYGAQFEGLWDRETMPTLLGPRDLNFSKAYFGWHYDDLPCPPLRLTPIQKFSYIGMVSWPRADLSEASVTGLYIENSDFGAANFSNINNGSIKPNCPLERRFLDTGENMGGPGAGVCALLVVNSSFASADFSNSYLVLRVKDSNFMGVNFSNLKKESYDVEDENLTRHTFSESDIAFSKFVNADLNNSIFRNVNAEGADFYSADLRNAEFINVNLNGANFTSADLTGAYLEGSDLQGATMPDGTLFDGDYKRFTNPN